MISEKIKKIIIPYLLIVIAFYAISIYSSYLIIDKYEIFEIRNDSFVYLVYLVFTLISQFFINLVIFKTLKLDQTGIIIITFISTVLLSFPSLFLSKYLIEINKTKVNIEKIEEINYSNKNNYFFIENFDNKAFKDYLFFDNKINSTNNRTTYEYNFDYIIEFLLDTISKRIFLAKRFHFVFENKLEENILNNLVSKTIVEYKSKLLQDNLLFEKLGNTEERYHFKDIISDSGVKIPEAFFLVLVEKEDVNTIKNFLIFLISFIYLFGCFIVVLFHYKPDKLKKSQNKKLNLITLFGFGRFFK